MRVRLRRRRTVSGSLTPNTPIRASTFLYTNGISKHSLTSALQSSGEHEGGTSTEGAHKGGSKVSMKERGSRESSEEKKSGTDAVTEKRLQRFERHSFRLREYKLKPVGQMSPMSLRSERMTAMDSAKDAQPNSREAVPVGGSDSYSSPEMSPAHSRSKSDEIANESGGKVHRDRHSLLLPSEASQRLLLSSSSSALTVSSSASSHSLQQPTSTAPSTHNTTSVPASEKDPSQAGLPSVVTVDEAKNPTFGNKAIDGAVAESDTKQVDVLPREEGQLEDQSPSFAGLQSGAAMHTIVGMPQALELMIGEEHALKESGGDVFLPAKEPQQDHPRARNRPVAERSTPTRKEKKAKIKRRHTVEYPRDVAKYRKG